MSRNHLNRLAASSPAIIAIFVLNLFVSSLAEPAMAQSVEKINQRLAKSGARWRAGHTSMSGLAPEEIRARLLPPSSAPPASETTSTPAVDYVLPSSLNWRSVGGRNYVTPVKNQGNYGSCWAMANTATLESWWLRKDATLNPATFNLSEQVMISCGNFGGTGPYDFLRDSGLPADTCYTYQTGPGDCSAACLNWQSQPGTKKIGGWGLIAKDLQAIKTALNLYGPIVADLYPDEDFFFYAGGVFHTTATSPVFPQGHAVSVIGYDDETSCIGEHCGYFIAKNSWGDGWGEGGFFKIAYSELDSQIKFGLGAIAFLDPCDYNLSTHSSSFDFRGGRGSVTVNPIPEICSWKVDWGWLSWVFPEGEAAFQGGTDTFRYRVDENLEATERTATFNIQGQEVRVTQSGRPKHQIRVYWSGTGRGELVIKETWRGRSTNHLCDTATAPPGAPFCEVEVLDGTVITLSARGYPGYDTIFQGYSDLTALPCVNDTSGGECTFSAHALHYITAAFSGSGGQPTPTPAATATAIPPVTDLSIIAPAAGATLKAGKTATVRFRSSGGGNFQLLLTNNGKKAGRIGTLSAKKGGVSTLNWRVPANTAAGNGYRILLKKKGCSSCDALSGAFSVLGKGLVLTSPRANSNILPGSQLKIAWSQGGKLCPSLKLQLLDGNSPQLTIQPKLKSAAAGSYRWNVPSTLAAGSGYRLKLSCNGGSSQSISGPLNVMAFSTPTPLPPTPTVAIPTAAPTATIVPIPAPEAISLSVSGLGDSQLVTTQSSALIRGSAQAAGGIESIRCSNSRTGAEAAASGGAEWQVTLNLQSGDNPIACRLRSLTGNTAEQRFTLTLSSEAVFTSSLDLSDDVVFINETSNLSAKVALSSTAAAGASAIVLMKTDAGGVPQQQSAGLADNGADPDEVPLDLTYSAALTLNPASTGDTCYRAKVTKGGQDYYSETKCVQATTHVTDADLNTVAAIGSVAKDTFDLLLSSGRSTADAAAGAAAALKGLNGVSESGSNGMDGVWWVTSAGIFGGYSSFTEGKRGSVDPADEIQSPKALMISPFIQNTRYPIGSSFIMGDDYYTTWRAIQARQSCNLYCADSFRNLSAGNVWTVSIGTFKQLGEWGYIHFSTHGNIYYNGLFSKWKDEWGRDLAKTLRAYYAAVGIHSGFRLEQAPDGSWTDKSIYEKDLKAGRMALFSRGQTHIEPVLLPGFFRRYLGKLPNSVVALASCYSMFNHSLADAFLANGAAAVVGYSMPVQSSYCGNTTTTIAESLIEGKTIKQAYDAAIARWTDNDGTGAYIRMKGNEKTVVYQGGVKNGDFEAGKLTPWEKEPGTRAFVLPEFAGISPIASTHFGYLTTGPGSPAHAGILTQAVCVPPAASTLSFSYRYLSQEFAGRNADVFLVTICPIDFLTGQIAADCVSTGYTWSQDTFTLNLAGGLQLVPGLDAPGSETRMTPTWLSGVINEDDLRPYRGQSISLSLWAADTGADLDGDTTVLIDDVKIE